MAKISLNFAYYVFLLTFCIDEGDGLWKKTDREILQRDIKLYKKIAERVEHELQEYYTEYERRGRLRLNVNRHFYGSNHQIPKINDRKTNEEKKENQPLFKTTKISSDLSIYNKTINIDSIPSNKLGKSNIGVKPKGLTSKWPKFEEILLAIGKKYDWKNDRWIKVKEKFKVEKDSDEFDNSIMFHEKHRFNYRTIKLNRGKNKRNVVIAVTAVR